MPVDLNQPDRLAAAKQARLQRIATTIETQLLSDIQALNTRNFSPTTSPLYLDRPHNWTITCNLHGKDPREEDSLTPTEWMTWVYKVLRKYPNWKVVPVDWNTIVNEVGRRAEVYMNVENEGLEEGLKRRIVLRFEYRFEDSGPEGGRWMLVGYKGVQGMVVGT